MKQFRVIIPILILIAFASGIEGQSGSDPYINLIYPKVDPTYNSLLMDGYPASGVGSYATPQKPILLNPASMATVPQTQVAFDHQRFFWGIGEGLYSSSFVYAHHFLNRGIGLSFGHFGSEMMSMQSIGIHYGQRLIRAANPRAETNRVGLYGGISLRMRRKGYNDSNFRLADPGDPLLAGDLAKTAFSGGLGITYQAETWRAFVIGDDINSPNMALQEGVTDKLPMQIQ
ncbi:MAG: type IX secretion system membrane protein PorP/SprF, partial [bacterium]